MDDATRLGASGTSGRAGPTVPSVGDAAAAPAAVLTLLPGIAWMSDADDWQPQWVSESVRRVAGYEPAVVVGVAGFWAERLHPDDRARILRVVEEGIERGESPDYDYRWRVSDGSYHWFRDRLWVVPAGDGRRAMVGFMVDVTAEYEEREARLAAERQRDQLLAAIEQSTDIVIITDDAGVVTYANPAIERILGLPRSAVVGQGVFHFADLGEVDAGDNDDNLRQAAAAALAGERWEGEYDIRTRAGRLYHFESAITPVRDESGRVVMTLGIHRDMTHVRRLEARLTEAARVEAIGQLAGGVAHDFNNILTAILGYTNLIAQRQDPGSPILDDLEQVRVAGERAQRLTSQLLALGRRSMLRPAAVDVGELVAGLAPMLDRLIGEDLEVRVDVGDEPTLAFVDGGQLEQAVVNLVVNARNAMPEGGRIHLAVDARQGDGKQVPAGTWAVVAVRDSGVGMTPEVASRIFEPFYTTDEFGQGTGLGLAVVDGFVKMSGGRILVTTQPGVGSTFELWLPLPPAGADHAEVRVDAASPPSADQALTVLLAEDDPLVRSIARRALETAGHRVLLAANGSEAIEVAARFQGTIDVLLADVVMPGARGPQAAEEIRAARPGIRVVLTSGYTEGAVSRRGILLDAETFLAKPYSMEQLLAAVAGRDPGEA